MTAGHWMWVGAMLSRVLIATTVAMIGQAHAGETCRDPSVPFLRELATVSAACRHVLCGQIFSTKAPDRQPAMASCADDAWTSLKSAATSALSTHGALLLGETHDNGDHHRLQAAIVDEFSVGGSATDKPAVVFEQIRDDQQSGLDRFAFFNRSAARLATPSDLKRFIDWDKSGWPKDAYDPLFKAVIGAGLAIYSGDVPRAAIMKAAKEGEGALAADERARLGLVVPLGDKLDGASLIEIEQAHCGALPKSAFAGMAYAQRYRDAHLADALMKAADRHRSAILIAGDGHVRTDRGVPWYIRQRAPGKGVVSLMFIEVEDGKTDPQSYVPLDPDGKPAADYIVFAARAERSDPCEHMRAK